MKTQGPTGFATSGYQTGDASGELAHLQGLLDATAVQAEDMLAAFCLRQPVRCPRCGDSGCRPRGRRRYLCSSCRNAFGLFEGTWLSRRRITPRAWVLTLKGFELGLGGQEISELTGLSMPTVYKTLETIRMAVASLDPRWEGPADSLETPRGIEEFLAQGRVAEPFRRFLLRQTAKHCGIRAMSFPLYLKEYELRFNHRGRPLFDLLADAVARRRTRTTAAAAPSVS